MSLDLFKRQTWHFVEMGKSNSCFSKQDHRM
ncbi:hypothetical protein FP742_22280 [Vibrio parahaemolyticus]|uniref:Uncharacterized protein n=2 Tax=Vibrio parahaemolyticus TaxID=670 RepID=A0A2R9VV16_VIBPH|nr:hypothetical protein RK51_019715 [Vibrio parahaemolyticus]QGG35786.1 hypothetical protein GH799_22195 [Vibrio parahaemolyticus 10329]BAC62183.1 hypothetical protein [Vibrio parahaemolyticus RIMD 2210633]AUW38948.1 hypothetical protein AL464_25250 [Vibrio parahaemolyticus]AVJ53991.1 hypothetical protein A6J30_25795 [Vibrio parahaemolyticus]